MLKSFLKFLVSFALVASAKSQVASDCEIIETKLGKISGVALPTIQGIPNTNFCCYRGIRYAVSPTGNLRFKPPVASGAWDGIYNASYYGNTCIAQSWFVGVFNFTFSEDCLFLNVFTPNKQVCEASTGKIPVLIYIHGGSFTEGNGDDMVYGPNRLLTKCVVLVTINYRLGTFGFLSLQTPEYSGNMAYKDQKLAIKWVKNNIEAFGGDPDRITVFGHCAGAVGVMHQAMNDESKQNFNQIYSIGSTPLNYDTLMKLYNHSDWMIAVAEMAGQTITTQKELISFLNTANPDVFVTYTSHHGPYGFLYDTPWSTVVESPDAIEPFLTVDPLELYKTKVNTIPTIITTTTIEYSSYIRDNLADPSTINYLDGNFNLSLPFRDIDQTACQKEMQPLLAELREFYHGDDPINASSIRQFTRMMSDMNFVYYIEKTIALLAKSSTAPIRYQIHNPRTPMNLFITAPGVEALGGAGHGDDLPYIFYMKMLDESFQKADQYQTSYQPYIDAKKVSDVLLELLVSYAATGTPSSETGLFSVEDYPVVGQDTETELAHIQVSNTGIPVSGINWNRDAYLLWQRLDQQADEIRKMPCNQNPRNYPHYETYQGFGNYFQYKDLQ